MKNAMLRQASARVNELARPQVPHDQRVGGQLGVVVEIALAPHAQFQAIGLELVVLHKSSPTGSTSSRPSIVVLIGIEMNAVDAADADDAPASKNAQLISAAIARTPG